MRNIYSSIDIGTDTIKLVTLEVFHDKYNVLAATTIESAGVKQGLIYDANLISGAIKKILKIHESKLGTKVDKVLAIVPSNDLRIDISSIDNENNNSEKIITGDFIFSLLQRSLKGKVSNNEEVVGIYPIEYVINKEKRVKNPLGLEGDSLAVKSVITTLPLKNVYSVVNILENLGLEVIDITISGVGSYYATKNKELDSKIVALVDIGADKTVLSIFNKGIIIKNSILPVGGNVVDYDIAATYKLSLDDARYIRYHFAVCNRKYADNDEEYACKDEAGSRKIVNQYALAELIETRLVVLLKNIKNEINRLTNREIGYIIITGGITSMLGFSAIVEDFFTRNASVLHLGMIGIRDNRYAAAFGSIKYFVEKLDLREKDYTMFSDEKVEEMLQTRKKIGSGSVVSKIFEKIFD